MSTHVLIYESLTFGFHTVRKHSALVFKVILTLFALQFAYSTVASRYAHTIFGLFGAVVLALALLAVAIGTTIITLRLACGESARYVDIVPPPELAWKFLLSAVLTGLAILLPIFVGSIISGAIVLSTMDVFLTSGSDPFAAMPTTTQIPCVVVMALACVLAFYIFIRLMMVRYVILDRKGVVESLRESYRMTSRETLRLSLFVLVVLVCNLAGVMCFFVGALVTLPVSLIAWAHIYLKLAHR